MTIKHGDKLQKSLLAFMSLKRVIHLHGDAEKSEQITHHKIDSCVYNNQVIFLNSSGIKIDDIELAGEYPSVAINRTVLEVINELRKLDLVLPDTGDNVARVELGEGNYREVDCGTYFITAKGLETALKLQEHLDNKERFEQQIEISNTLKTNSTKSLNTSRVAVLMSVVFVVFAFYRISIANEQLEIAQRRLALLEEKTERYAGISTLQRSAVKVKMTATQLVNQPTTAEVNTNTKKPVASDK